MMILHPTSVSDSLDSAAEQVFFKKSILPAVRDDFAALLINRQIQTGANSGFFIPFASETRTQYRLFSGETLHTEFAVRHIQLIEAARLLTALSPGIPSVARSILLSEQRMNTMCYSKFCSKGECRSLTVAYMRYLAVHSTPDDGSVLGQLLSDLSGHRDGKGRWHGFPYFFTLLMLSEADHPLADEELHYTGSQIDRLSGQNWANDRYSIRCQSLLHNALARSENYAHPLLLGQYG
jgi:hypothetical protein